MNCVCDEFLFPPEIRIPAGKSRLNRRTGTFAEFRRALLRAASIRDTATLHSHPLWSARFLTEPDRNGLETTLEEKATRGCSHRGYNHRRSMYQQLERGGRNRGHTC